jgi:GNAT superfamily N-acetyltransferase
MASTRFPHLQQVIAQAIQIKSLDFTPELAAQLKDLRLSEKGPDGGTSAFTKWLADPEAQYSPSWAEVAYQGDTPVGWSGIGRTRGRNGAPVIGVFVADSQRRQGLGEKLIQAVLKTYRNEFFDPELDDPTILYSANEWPKLKSMIDAAGFHARPLDSIGWEEAQADEWAQYPTTSAVLADAPLPDLTDEEFWKRNFVRTQDRPGKRLGVELKHYLEFHRKEHPKGSAVTPQDLCQMLHMTPKEANRIGLAIQYLIARKSIEKTKTPDRYRVL